MIRTMIENRIWFQDSVGVRSAEITSPASWHGEDECIIGPFSNEAAARNFSRVRRPYARACQRYFVRGDAWYVQLTSISG